MEFIKKNLLAIRIMVAKKGYHKIDKCVTTRHKEIPLNRSNAKEFTRT